MNKQIFKLNKGNIEVYNLNPLEEKIMLFKEKEIVKIPENERVLISKHKKNASNKKNIIYHNVDFSLKKTNNKNNDILIKECLINNYLNGNIKKVKRSDGNNDLYFLELLFKYKNKKIQLTNDLCNELLIENEDYNSDYLDLERLNILSPLFDIDNDPLFKIRLNEFKKVFKTNLIEESLDDKLDYLEKSTKVYEKLKS